jgi:ubiquinone/menaquinone biosynthesis C-methylase UbiE
MHAVYEVGRALPEHAIANWISVFARFAPQDRPLTVLDLGSGTGRFSAALAREFGGPVHAVEPSAKMREAAMARHAHPAVTVTAGAAERIPLPDSSCDLAMLFLSWHHVADPERGAAELARVVRPGGTVLLALPSEIACPTRATTASSPERGTSSSGSSPRSPPRGPRSRKPGSTRSPWNG